MNRRNFLKGTAIGSVAIAASTWPAMAETLGMKSSPMMAVVYDERYADCRAFAETLVQQGATSFATGGDAASVWYGPLRAHLARCGGSVAGMTTDSDLTVSRACAREVGLKIVYEGAHDCRASGRLKHLLRGAGEERGVYTALLRAESPWAESIATALSLPTFTDRIVRAAAGIPSVTTAQSAGHPGYLTSWLLRSMSAMERTQS